MDLIRKITSEDYDYIISHLDQWWAAGRKMSDMLPRLFFNHFSDTSFIIQEQDTIKGFLIGFVSPTKPHLGYVHFIGVNPTYRKNGIGKRLHYTFMETVKQRGVTEIACVTSPLNMQSIRFHTRLGFAIKEGPAVSTEGIAYTPNYDGPEEHRVIFSFKLN